MTSKNAAPYRLTEAHIQPGHPNFQDLPWRLPVGQWAGETTRLEMAPVGLTRHPVVFVNYNGVVYVIKEMPVNNARREFDNLEQIARLNLPVVSAVGWLVIAQEDDSRSVLITQFLDRSIPYSSLFGSRSLEGYRKHLLDAVAGLLVQLHTRGVYWGDCSLSNTLFRRDAGELQAYLVDAESTEHHPGPLSPTLRLHDLDVMDENITSELIELARADAYMHTLHARDIAGHIRQRYLRLWDEITREVIIAPNEHYRIQEHIHKLNEIGFSVSDVELLSNLQSAGIQLRLRVRVADRNFHRNQLFNLTGLLVEERQAQRLMNEIQQMKADLAQENNRRTPLSVAAYRWLEERDKPTLEQLQLMLTPQNDPAELYCQVLEHKWYLSERARRDVGHQFAAQDYLREFSSPHPAADNR